MVLQVLQQVVKKEEERRTNDRMKIYMACHIT